MSELFHGGTIPCGGREGLDPTGGLDPMRGLDPTGGLDPLGGLGSISWWEGEAEG